ncbi:Nucleoid-associated protein YbaB [Coxiella endosymbiont of Amblyomma nuttalli]|nr:Nucleoid-associated protein YbaB [Coxiella endosymbiont of Amblyomma nuttalli]
MTDNFNISNFMKNAKKIQEIMQKAQDELTKVRITGESGAGLVKVTITAKHDILEMNLADELFREPKEIIEDLIKAAFNDANQKAVEITQEKMISAGNSFGDINKEREEVNH